MSNLVRVAADGPGVKPISSRRASPDEAAALLPLALSTPTVALARAHQLLRAGTDEATACYAHQAAGIVLRDLGQLPAALHELQAAIRSARRIDDREREADVRATFGAALVMAGRAREGLAELDAAAQTAHGPLLARIRLRRAHVLHLLGRFDEALVDLQRGLAVVRRTGDALWEARILNNRCLVHLAVGAFGRAAADASTALTLFDRLGQDLESVQASHNHAVIAFCRGDVPDALHRLELADQRYRALGIAEPTVVIDRGQMLLAAGLASEAVAAAEAALAESGLQPVKRAELLFVAAKASLAAGDLARARRWATQSRRLFHAQQRASWEARSRFLACQARYLSGERSAELLATVLELATRLAELRAEEDCLAYLLAGRLARHRGQHAVATANFTAAARRRHGSPLTRATGWLALAMRAAEQNAERRLFAACAHGLDALDEHRLVFGAAELRALATFHGRDLATLALEAAHRTGSPRSMLAWSERWRATSLAEPSVQPPDDPQLERELAALRDAVRRLEEQDPNGVARHQRDHYEAAVRRRRLSLSGAVTSRSRLDLAELFAALGDIRLVALVGLGGVLYSLTVAHGRVRKHRVGELDAAQRELDFARFALRRAAHGRPAGVTELAERLQRALLGPAAELLSDGPVVIVPPATLHSAPWSLLPALAGVPVSISGSAAMWLRAKASASDPPADRRVTLVLGPDLGSGAAEIGRLAELHPAATVLGSATGNGPATADRVLISMTGAWLAHIAAHGSFRADSPLFSALRIDGGPLFVHDFDRLSRAPHRVVLSACDSGVGAPVGADELLGTVSGLLRAGSVGVLASVVPVNDAAATPFMVAVHQALLGGRSLPEAALVGRLAARGDPLASATAASFNVWGI